MKKLLSLIAILVILGMASAYALNETEYGPANITTCFATGTTDMTSGNVVVFQTTNPTYWGREVTGSSTDGLKPYGVVVDTTSYSGAEMSTGKWIRVQTYGYCPIVRLCTYRAVTVNSSHLITSGEVFRAGGHEEFNCFSGNRMAGGVTGNSVALETRKGIVANQTIRAWLGF